MSDVIKRCEHRNDPSKINKCEHPWYMSPFRFGGVLYRENVSEWALVTLNETITTRTRADQIVADEIRPRIRRGEYVKARAVRATVAPQSAPDLTLDQLVAAFERDVLDAEGAPLDAADADDPDDTDGDDTISEKTIEGNRARLRQLCAHHGYGARPARALDAAALVLFKRSLGKVSRSTWAKHRSVIDRLCDEGVRTGALLVNPFDTASRAQANILKRKKDRARLRRLLPGEFDRLTAAALQARRRYDGQRLRDLIEAAVECGARAGELGALQWRDVVDLTAPYVAGRYAIGAVTRIVAVEDGAAKTGEPRIVPSSRALRALYARRQVNPLTGQPYPLDAYVFGNVIGERIKFPRRGWEICVVRSTGKAVTMKPDRSDLSPESRAVFHAAALHFHDLRREGASRWHESKLFTLLEIRDMLGHASIRTTEIYLGIKPGSEGAIDAMRALDERREREAREAAALAEAAGGSTDHNAITAGAQPVTPTTGPRLVKGRKAGATK